MVAEQMRLCGCPVCRPLYRSIWLLLIKKKVTNLMHFGIHPEKPRNSYSWLAQILSQFFFFFWFWLNVSAVWTHRGHLRRNLTSVLLFQVLAGDAKRGQSYGDKNQTIPQQNKQIESVTTIIHDRRCHLINLGLYTAHLLHSDGHSIHTCVIFTYTDRQQQGVNDLVHFFFLMQWSNSATASVMMWMKINNVSLMTVAIPQLAAHSISPWFNANEPGPGGTGAFVMTLCGRRMGPEHLLGLGRWLSVRVRRWFWWGAERWCNASHVHSAPYGPQRSSIDAYLQKSETS